MSRNDYRPVNLSEDHHLQLNNNDDTTTNDIEQTVTTNNNEYGQPILMAIAIPDSIRPPKVSYIDNNNNINNSQQTQSIQSFPKSFLRRLLILVVGIMITYLTFFESLLLILLGYANSSPMELILGLIWFGATLGVLIGSLIGAYKGQWRFLVPGLVLQYVVNILTKVLVSDLPDENISYGGGGSYGSGSYTT